MMGIYLISIVFMLIGWLVSMQLKRKFKEYSLTPISSGMSGQQIAERMLRDNNIHDVKVISVEGRLTDHYNPLDKTVNLSHDVFYGRNAAAAAMTMRCGDGGCRWIRSSRACNSIPPPISSCSLPG